MNRRENGRGLPNPEGKPGRWVQSNGDGSYDEDAAWSLYKNFEEYIYNTFRIDSINDGVTVGPLKVVAHGIYVEIMNWTRDDDKFRAQIKAFGGSDGVEVDSELDDDSKAKLGAYIPLPRVEESYLKPKYSKRRTSGVKFYDQPKIVISILCAVVLLATLTTESSQWHSIVRILQ